MSVKLTGEAERDRIISNRQTHKNTWELLRSHSLVKAVRFARDNGWEAKNVQVRFEPIGTDMVEYIVEPYEEGCSCRGLLKYQDYYGTEDDNGNLSA